MCWTRTPVSPSTHPSPQWSWRSQPRHTRGPCGHPPTFITLVVLAVLASTCQESLRSPSNIHHLSGPGSPILHMLGVLPVTLQHSSPQWSWQSQPPHTRGPYGHPPTFITLVVLAVLASTYQESLRSPSTHSSPQWSWQSQPPNARSHFGHPLRIHHLSGPGSPSLHMLGVLTVTFSRNYG